MVVVVGALEGGELGALNDAKKEPREKVAGPDLPPEIVLL